MILVVVILAICIISLWSHNDDASTNIFFGSIAGIIVALLFTVAVSAVWDIGNFSVETTVYKIEAVEFVGDNAVITSPDDKIVLTEYVIELDDCEFNTLTQRIEHPKFMPWVLEFGVLDFDSTICINASDYVGNANPR